jgi:Calcipressin
MLPSNNFDDGEIKESPFHLRPPVPERNFLISPPGSPPVGWVAIREDPPNETPLAQDLVEALERLKSQKASRSRRRLRRGDGSRSHSVSTDGGNFSHSATDEEEDGVMLIPESAAGLSVRVEDWGTRRLVRLHQAREKSKRNRTNSNSGDAPASKKSKNGQDDDGERQRGALSEMEEELDQELDDGRYKAPMVDWNKIDHARTRIENFILEGDNHDDDVNIQVEMGDENDDDDEADEEAMESMFLAENDMFRSGRSITVKMPKLGVKPKPASMPPLSLELDSPGSLQGASVLGFMATAMPPLKPTAMPPRSSNDAP